MTIKKLIKSTDGTFSIILATMLVAITTTIALGIDYSRLSEARASLQNKLDAAFSLLCMQIARPKPTKYSTTISS